MVGTRTKSKVARWHRRLGLVLTVPLIGWIVSSAAMMLVTMNAEQGLAGVYHLSPYNSMDVPLTGASVSPSEVMQKATQQAGIDRAYWLRLESRGPHLLYVVKPTPYALAMTFDAFTGERLDPLPDSIMRTIADEALVGTRAAALDDVGEYNRYYTVDEVPAVRATMEGQQPSWLFISRDEGRTLRRLNADSHRFTWWYQTFHVNQWGNSRLFWTGLLYVLAAGVVVLAILGFQLFWWRRKRVVPAAKAKKQRPRTLHRSLGLLVGAMLVLQVAVGSYLWLNLGPLEDPFRGKGSFNPDWEAGILATAELADPATVLERTAPYRSDSPRPVQSIEWRDLNGEAAWVITLRRDEFGTAHYASTGEPVRLEPEEAGRIAQQEVLGTPPFEVLGEGRDLWMDVNRSVPTYSIRFEDRHKTDVKVSPATGQVIQRRPGIWRAFGPYLRVHMFTFTRNPFVDVTLLAIFQISVLALIATGWILQFSRKSKRGGGGRAVKAAGANRARGEVLR